MKLKTRIFTKNNHSCKQKKSQLNYKGLNDFYFLCLITKKRYETHTLKEKVRNK